MKLSLFFFLFISLPTLSLMAQQDSFIEDYLERLENSKNYTLVVAEMLPEEQYGFKATPESLSFSENLMHIGFAMNWHSQTLLAGRPTDDWQTDTKFKTAKKSKAEMITIISHTFDTAIATIKQFDPSHLEDELEYFGLKRSKRQILMLLSDHITHHRAQMLVSLRLNGLTPPRYVLYQ